MLGVQGSGGSGPPTFFWTVGRGTCPECFEMAKPCSGCMGRVCKNGHLSVISKYFTPCPRHEVLDVATKSCVQKVKEWFHRPSRYIKVKPQ